MMLQSCGNCNAFRLVGTGVPRRDRCSNKRWPQESRQ